MNLSHDPDGALPAGLIYYRREDGIDMFRFLDSTRETVNAWAKRVVEIEMAAGAGGHIRAVYDIRGQWISPYGVLTMLRMSRLTVPLLASSVAVISDSQVLATVYILLKHLPQSPNQARHIVTVEDEAFRWLNERKLLIDSSGSFNP